MSYWSGSPASRREARRVLASAKPAASADINAAAVEYGTFAVWASAAVVLAMFIAFVAALDLIGQRADASGVALVVMGALCGHTVRQRNALRARLRGQPLPQPGDAAS